MRDDELVDAALAAEHVGPELVGRLGERVVVQRGLEDPVVALELVLELAGAPARVAGEDAPPRRHRQDVVRLVERREAERAEERHRRVVRVDELAEHEHGVRLHGAAEPDLLAVVDEILELRHELGDRRRRRPVQHEPGRALLVVLGDEHDGAAEVRVVQARRRDEQLSFERVHGYRGVNATSSPPSSS